MTRSDTEDTPTEHQLPDLPPATPLRTQLGSLLHGELAVFLDYDGTLTPIVDDPDDAVLTPEMRSDIETLAEATLVAIVSGRDLDDVRAKIGIDGLAYGGSHGFDILHPDGTRRQLATEHTDALDRAQAALQRQLDDIPGVRVERKRFAIAVHDRQVDDPGLRERIGEVVTQVAAEHPELRITGGKRIHELRPDIDWDKGRAIEALLSELDAEDLLPIYIGDDLTDEDGFRAVKARGGVAVVVSGEDDDRRTLADAVLASTDEAGRFLQELTEFVLDRRTAG